MDPIANMKEQIDLSNSILSSWISADDTPTRDQLELIAEEGVRLAELVFSLVEWRRKGGFDPLAEQMEGAK